MKKRALLSFLLVSLLLLSACGKKEKAPAVPPVGTDTVTETAKPTPTPEPTPEPTPTVTVDQSSVQKTDVVQANVKSAKIDKDHHLIVTDNGKKEHDMGYVGGENLSKKISVSFFDTDGSLLKVDMVDKGGDAVPPTDPMHTDMEFIGWSEELTNITEDTVVLAQYVPRGTYFLFNYYSEEGDLLHKELVPAGTAPKGYELPAKDGFVFAGWNGMPAAVDRGADLTPMYVKNDAFALAMSSASAKAGETVELTFSLKNAPDVCGISVSVACSDALTLTDFTFDAGIGGTGTGPQKLPASGEVKFNWFNIEQQASGDTVLLTLHFAVDKNAAAGEYWVIPCFGGEDIVNLNEEELHPSVVCGCITVKE